ncbi:MAG: nicotinate phosphoribosyltransferase [Candidatus Bathyarchaeia archaeon]
MRIFHTASDEEIKSGKTTDIYFVRTKKVLEEKGLANVKVVAEVTTGGLPRNWHWAILCGVEEIARLFEGIQVNVYSMPEGSLFHPYDFYGIREPVMNVEGSYGDFCIYETPLLGLICQASGIATVAARMRKIVGKATLISFGIRRAHPALSPMIDRAAYVGGFDGVSSLSGAEIIKKEPVGTMPHALIITLGDQVKAWKAFDEIISKDVPRIALVDTYFDEKTETIMAAEALKNRLHGVRLDTPGSRKGDFSEIIREVRWELNARGYSHVKIYVSGGINEENIEKLCKAGAEGFGIGTSVSNAPAVDFAMDIVEMEGKLCAKRGKLGGKKQVWRCHDCMLDIVQLDKLPRPKCPKCHDKTEPLLKPIVLNGKIVAELPSVDEIRNHVLRQIEKIAI